MSNLNSISQPARAFEKTVEGFIDKKELARRIKRSTRTVGTWMRKGRLPYYKVGLAVLFKWEEVEAHLRQFQKEISTTENPKG